MLMADVNELYDMLVPNGTDNDKPDNDNDKTKTKTAKNDYKPASFKATESLIRTYSMIKSIEPIKTDIASAKATMELAEKTVKTMESAKIPDQYIKPARDDYAKSRNTYEAKTKELNKSIESIKTDLASLDELIKSIATLQSDIEAIAKTLIEERDKATKPAKNTKNTKKVNN